jgi:hypothetical protein
MWKNIAIDQLPTAQFTAQGMAMAAMHLGREMLVDVAKVQQDQDVDSQRSAALSESSGWLLKASFACGAFSWSTFINRSN